MKTRSGFVSNSSSSSFVLFGTKISEDKINIMYENYIKTSMIAKYGSSDKVPVVENKWGMSDENIYLALINDENVEEIIDDICKYEKAEVLNILYVDDWTGFVFGFSPTWFQQNPTKTWNDAIEEHTEILINLDFTMKEIKFDYIEEVVVD